MKTSPEIPRLADVLYHDIISPPDVLETRAIVRAFAEEKIKPVARDVGEMEECVANFPFETFHDMGRAGLFKIPFTLDDGGIGLKHRVASTASAIEEIAYFSNSFAAIYDVNCILAGRTLERASDSIRNRYLLPLVEGAKIGSFATTEPNASTDLSTKSLQTKATRVDGGYRVTGRKRWITNSPVADFVIALCNSTDGLVLLVIDLKQPGVAVGVPDKKMGNRGQLTADVVFDNVEVPEENRIGDSGAGLRIALQTLTYGRIGIAAAGVGMAQACFDIAVAHLKQRKAFGRPIGSNQYWQFKMAERAAALENVRTLTLKAALRMDSGEQFPEPEAAMAKFLATELSVDMARDAIQVTGGYGYMRSLSYDNFHSPIETMYRDAKIGEIYEGTNEIQRMLVARQIFGREIVG